MTEIKDELTKKELRTELIAGSGNSCCICQTPFIHAHHIDLDNENDTLDNLAPLCPNHHCLAHAKSNMFLNLTPERIRAIRDKWYEYVENRKQNFGLNLGVGRLKIKNFVWSRRTQEYATHSWTSVFASLDEGYRKMKVGEIIDRVFSSSNPNELKTYLQSVKTMYAGVLEKEEVQKEFKEICNAFGFDYDGRNVV